MNLKNEELKINAKNNNVEAVKKLLLEGANINYQDESDSTALIYAAEKGNLEVLQVLLQTEGINVNLTNKAKENALIYAGRNGHVDAFELLLANGANPYYNNEHGPNALFWAVEKGNLEVVNNLLRTKRIDINLINNKNETALFWAVKYDHVTIVNALLANGANPKIKDQNDSTALFLAAAGGYFEVFKVLLDTNAFDINHANYSRHTVLLLASRYTYKKDNQNKINNTLLEKGANTNYKEKRGYAALLLASKFYYNEDDQKKRDEKQDNYKNIIKILLEKGANTNYKDRRGYTALLWAAEKGNLEVLQLLLQENDIDINVTNNKDETALILAVKQNHLDMVKALLEKGANPNHIDESEDTALFIAVEKGNLEILQILLKAGDIDINLKNRQVETAITIAARTGNVELVKALIGKGTNYNPENKCKDTALLWAAEKGNLEVLQFLLKDADIDINLKNRQAQIVLMWAARSGDLKVIKALLENGATYNPENKCEDTPLFWAANIGNLEVLDFLFNAAENKILEFTKNEFETALIAAAKYGHTNIVNALLEKETSVYYEDKDGYTALLWAARYGNLDVVKALIAKGANVNHITKGDQTALLNVINNFGLSKNGEKKAMSERLKIVEELIANGANVNHKNSSGKTAIDCAYGYNCQGIKKTLENFVNCKNFITNNTSSNIAQINTIVEQDNIDDNVKERQIFNFLESFDKVLETKFQENEIVEENIKNFLKREFIDNLKFANNYSLLHVALLNNMNNLTSELIKTTIDTTKKDNISLTVWNYACTLLKPDLAFALKSCDKLTTQDQEFLENFKNLEWKENEEYSETKLNDEIKANNKELILSYYGFSLENQLESFDQELNTEFVF